jgi:Uma2 family endonuclease
MSTIVKLYTIDDLATMPTDEPWEIWEGELREVPGAGQEASAIAHWIGVLITTFVRPRNLGVVTGADGSYILSHEPLIVIVPDVAFVRREHLPGGVRAKSYAPVIPDFAVEVRSPTDRASDIRSKLRLYQRAGVRLLWWVNPERRTVSVYHSGVFVAEYGEDDSLDGGDVIPGFTVVVRDLFA